MTANDKQGNHSSNADARNNREHSYASESTPAADGASPEAGTEDSATAAGDEGRAADGSSDAGDDPGDAIRQALTGEQHDPTQPKDGLFIVGVGASAGGLEAIEKLFDHVPPDPGVAFVIVQHLSPDFKSLMDELLARHTQLAIRQVQDGMTVESNVIYLIPPKKNMVLSDGKLLLADQDPEGGLNLPIDLFFRSLAQDRGDRAVAVILSGTGSDGSRGIRAVHEAGGLVVVQDQETAGFDGMPRAAIATGMVDIVARPEEMADRILNFAGGAGRSEEAASPDLVGLPDEAAEIFAMLRKEYGIDFSLYKPATMSRRIERRMTLCGAASLGEYRRRLSECDSELRVLCKDLLVEVTQFFRDPDAFRRLKDEVIPALCRDADENGIRVWVAGCATGEEAYSLAMLFHDHIESLKKAIDVKIFATDVHRPSLEVAGNGRYPAVSVRDVPAEYLQRYFIPRDNDFVVTGALRQMVIFAPHNLTKDPPFTKLDLVVCRNVLIYFKPSVQKKVLTLFHFGLRNGGYLCLGPSENLAELADEFGTVDARWKLFRKRRDVRLAAAVRNPGSPLPLAVVGGSMRETGDFKVRNSQGQLFESLLNHYLAPGFVINEEHELLHVFGDLGDILHVPAGAVTRNVMKMVDDKLRIALSSALHRAAQDSVSVTYRAVETGAAAGKRKIRLTVDPLPQNDPLGKLYLARIEPEPPSAESDDKPEPGEAFEFDGRAAAHIKSLEGELHSAHEHLQSTVEELETSNEELQSTNEELVASNEELQSTNEELHSVNEELYTVNAEYQRKIEELTQLTHDMDNLLKSTEIATIFLDSRMRIRKFTPAASAVFNLVPHDAGRPLNHIVGNIRLDGETLNRQLEQVIREGTIIEQEVIGTDDDVFFLMRALPYRTENERIEGAVLTFTDITAIRRSQERLSQVRRRMEIALAAADIGIWDWDLRNDVVRWDSHLQRVLGLPADRFAAETLSGNGSEYANLYETNSDNFWNCVHADDAARVRAAVGRCLESKEPLDIDFRVTVEDKERYLTTRADITVDDDGNTTRMTGACLNITDRKKAEHEVHEAVRRRDHFLAVLSHELRNPLAAIVNACQVMQMSEGDPAYQINAGNIISRQADHMTRLMDDLLDVARINENKIHLNREPVNLLPIMQDALQSIRPRAEKNELTLDVQAPEGAVWVDGDSVRLLQIQLNLLQNAVKYTPAGGRIRYSLAEVDGEAEIRVEDNGVGMTADLQKRVFERFVQSEQTLARSAGGLGLGLTLVKTLVELHGGEVSVSSEGLGKGSRFVVRLPLTEAPPEPDEASTSRASSAQADEDTSEEFAARRVLLVEDNADNRRMMRMLLQMEGYHVTTAADGPSGLAAILAQRPDIAFVDIGLPGMDGYDVARQVRAQWGDEQPICLVALTGYGRPEDHEAVLEAGFDHHLVKPIRAGNLADILHNLPRPKLVQ